MPDTFDCTDVKAVLSGLIDDEIDADVRHRAERHIAECATCRQILDDAETLNDIVQRDLADWSDAELPISLEAGVLSQTILLDRRAASSRRWVTWSGWVACAASIALACVIWVVDGTNTTAGNDQLAAGPETFVTTSVYPTSLHQSWTYDPAENIDPASVQSVATAITRADAQTLFAATTVLELLQQTDADDATGRARLQQIVSYDNLLPRLRDARANLNPADREAVLATEAVMYQIMSGEDLSNVQQDVRELDLAERLNDLSDQRDPQLDSA